jgi:hypothetical protein
MKPVDKKEMPKLIALIGLTVCSLGYGVYALVGGTSVAAPPPAAKTQEQQTAQATPTAGSAAASDALLAELTRLEGVSDPVLVRDPFVITGSVDGAVPGTPDPPAPGPTVTATPTPTGPDRATETLAKRGKTLREWLGLEVHPPKGASGDDPRGGGSSSAAPGGTGPVILPPPTPATPPSVTVTGVMIPENGQGKSIAIVRVNNETRWLSVGDTVGQGFVVRSIHRTDKGSELEIVDSNDKKRHVTIPVN